MVSSLLMTSSASEGPAFHEGTDRVGNHLFRVMAHQQQLVFQGPKLLFELFAGVFPFRHRPTLAESPGDVIFSLAI